MKFISSGLLSFKERTAIDWNAPQSLGASNSEDLNSEDRVSTEAATDSTTPQNGAALPLLASLEGMKPESRSYGRAVIAADLDSQGADHSTNHSTDHGDDHGHICDDLHWGEEAALLDNSNVVLGTPLLPLDQTFLLHSNPTASKVIYLDFDGHTTTGTAWNNSVMGSSFYSPAFDTDGNPSLFSSAELTLIQNAWQRVAADFAAFDVNVTTQAPPQDWLINSGAGDTNFGIRVVMSSYGPSSSAGAGGIAYVNSFTSSKDTPVFVYNSTMLALANTISHEVGHSLGLSHDGTTGDYYSGHGTGATSWAPIMGASWSKNMSTWDNGTYYLSNNTGSTANYGKGADDISIITGSNGFGLVADLEGNAQAQSVALQLQGNAISQFGTIQTYWDQDWFRLELLVDSQVSLRFDPSIYRAFLDTDGAWAGTVDAYTAAVNDANTSTSYTEAATNLDLRINVFDGFGSQLNSFGTYGRSALFSQSLTAGSYYFCLDGQGYGDPTSSTPTGYSDYASIGNYLISGTVTATTPTTTTTSTTTTTTTALPAISLALNTSSVQEDGASNLVYTFTRSVVSADALTVNFTVAGSATNGSDYSGLAAGTNQAITFAAGAATATVVIDPTADTTVEGDETVALMLAAGTGYSIGTSGAVSGTIANDDLAPQASEFTSSIDMLTGTSSRDQFTLKNRADALLGPTIDSITNLQAGIDVIDTPSTRTTAISAKQLGSVSALTSAAIGTVLNAKGAFARGGASTFTYNDAIAGGRTFLALNDNTTGFNAATDSIIEITGFSGNLASLSIF